MTVSAAPFYHKFQLERRLLAPPSGSAAATFSWFLDQKRCFPDLQAYIYTVYILQLKTHELYLYHNQFIAQMTTWHMDE